MSTVADEPTVPNVRRSRGWRLRVLVEAGYPKPLAEQLRKAMPTCTRRRIAPEGLRTRNRSHDPAITNGRVPYVSFEAVRPIQSGPRTRLRHCDATISAVRQWYA